MYDLFGWLDFWLRLLGGFPGDIAATIGAEPAKIPLVYRFCWWPIGAETDRGWRRTV